MIAPRSIGPRRAGREASGLQRETRLLREELNWCYSQLDAAELEGAGTIVDGRDALLGHGVPTGSADELRRRSRQLEERLIKVTNRLRSRDLDDDTVDAGPSVTVETIRTGLPADTQLLEYYEARGTIFAFVVGRDRLEVRPVGTSERVRRLLGLSTVPALQAPARPRPTSTPSPKGCCSAARSHLRELYDELIAPLRPLLEARSLVIVPHGPLHRLPFHALLGRRVYLVDRFALSYAPSASVLHLCSMRPRPAGAGALVLAVPDAYNPGHRGRGGAWWRRRCRGRGFSSATSRQSTRCGSWAPAPGLIHVAAHGLFRRDNPMFSAIQLGGSRLTVLDLYELDLACELVVLSGCGTGLGVVEGGDEQIGLVRGLLYAGAQAVVATLWDAQDESTQRFMQAFYRALSERARSSGRTAGRHGRAAGRLPAPLLLGPVLPGWEALGPTLADRAHRSRPDEDCASLVTPLDGGSQP